jgi:hypothetical protein
MEVEVGSSVSDDVRACRQHPEVGSWHKADLDTHAFDPAPCHVPCYDPLGSYGRSDRLALCRLYLNSFVFTKPQCIGAVIDRVWALPIPLLQCRLDVLTHHLTRLPSTPSRQRPWPLRNHPGTPRAADSDAPVISIQ